MVVGMALAEGAASAVVRLAALGVGAGVGTAFGQRGAITPGDRAEPADAPRPGGSRAARALALLLIACALLGAVGFLCGATSGLLLLFSLGFVGVPSVVALPIADFATGLVAGALAGFFVEGLIGRVGRPGAARAGARSRGGVIGGVVGAVCGLLAAWNAGDPVSGLVLVSLGVGLVAALASLLLPAARRAPTAARRAPGEHNL